MGTILPTPLTRYQLLTMTTVVMTLALIAVGALVRTTGSGLGCPDWPLCHGRLVPPLERTAIIEYSHRTLASVVGLLIVSTSVVTVRTRRHDRAARALAVAALPLLGLQAYLGKVTVERELPAEVVAVHLGTALVLVSLLAVIAAFAVLGETRARVQSTERDVYLRKVVVAVVTVAAVLLGGAYVVGSGSTAACNTWPGCAQAPLPFLDGGREQAVHWFHRLSAIGGLAAVGWLLLEADRLDATAVGLRLGARALALLYVLQIVIGGLNIWSRFAPLALVGHLTVAAAIWVTLVLMLVAGRYAAQPAQSEARSSAQVTRSLAATRRAGAPNPERSGSGNRG